MTNLNKMLKKIRKEYKQSKSSTPFAKFNTRPKLLVVAMFEVSKQWDELSNMTIYSDNETNDLV